MNLKPSGTFAHSCTFGLLMAEQDAAPIGGIVLGSTRQSQYLLTPEVVLFEPSATDIHRGGAPATEGKPGTRLIFLNTPLTAAEQRDLAVLHRAVEKDQVLSRLGDSEFPYWVRIHALRILQQAKGRVDKAITMMLTHLELRVKKIPVMEDSILQDLQHGFAYFHGRDRSCRPVVVLRFERISRFSNDVEKAFKVLFFVFEFAVRHLMVPGRIENWVCIVDLRNTGPSISSLRICRDIFRLLEEVFCGRNVLAKVLHLPWIIRAIVMAFIPEDKKTKVEFVCESEIQNVMRKLCEPHQLEQQYGGTAPNVEKGEAYPFRFFPHCQRSGSGSPHESLHNFTDQTFHEGYLWDNAAKAEWQKGAEQHALTPAASAALNACIQTRVEPCRTMERWFESVNPKEAKRRKGSAWRGSEKDGKDVEICSSLVSTAAEYASTSETAWVEKDMCLKALKKASTEGESSADLTNIGDLASQSNLDDNDLKPTDNLDQMPEVNLRSTSVTQSCCVFCPSPSTKMSL